ncbi:protein Brevis radix-like 2 isoform X2 [Salvia miltiorrhiza]|uniref:protein Brevis radix-like 2 isoform X2 n=1 Tax=Salvia miltiorrhiza TaxID=226208 RepID=UPI0025ABB0EE|nr:protein Brevis radix-like 2 isoform X2 [Salvia miltiorrhiza]
MLTCIACSNSKQLETDGSLRQPPPEEEDDNAAVTPSTKQAIKSLTSQIKDMAVKASGAYKNCKPCSGTSGPKRGRAYVDSDAGSVSGRFYGSYRRTASLSSTPRLRGKELEAKLKALSSGSATPASVSGRTESLFMEEDEPKEWVAQVEPGVLITFVSLPQGGNDLKRIRFSREIFNKWQAQQWWGENYDKVMELYNVQRFSHHEAPLSTPPLSEDENLKLESAEDSPVTPPLSKEHLPRHFCRTAGVGYSSSESVENNPMKPGSYHESAGPNSTPKLSSISAAKTETSSVDASARSSSSREIDHSGELSVSNASDLETEWVEQDEPGVYITIRALPGGARELRRVRFSREKFGETQARVWWEGNRARIQQQYL